MPLIMGEMYICTFACINSAYTWKKTDKCGCLQEKVVGSWGEREFVLSCELFHTL